MSPLLLLAALALPGRAATARDLKLAFVSAVEPAERARLLEELSRTPPQSAEDAAALLDLFTRFPQAAVRQAAASSLRALTPADAALEPAFASWLSREEDEARLLGVYGALSLRAAKLLPRVRKLAAKRLRAPEPAGLPLQSERDAWWLSYEALGAVAEWEGAAALPLLKRQAAAAPAVASWLGRWLWAESLPQVLRWAAAPGEEDRLRARLAAGAPSRPEDARRTREAMASALADGSLDGEVRRLLALKLGASSTEEEAAALAAAHDAASDPRLRLLWAAAVFASGREAAVPLLARYAREAPDAASRNGAFLQLADMVGEEKARALRDDKK